jgi:thymidylate kinase
VHWEQANPLEDLARGLAIAGVRYCRWKAHSNPARIMSGEGDLDLLVHRADLGVFLRVATKAGFKRVANGLEADPPHEMHLYGVKADTGVLLHVHAQSALFANDSPLRRALPCIDEFVLCNSTHRRDWLEAMPAAKPAAALIAFVLQAMEAYGKVSELPRLFVRKEAREAKLQAMLRMDGATDWRALLGDALPTVPPELFAECVEALSRPTSWLHRYRVAQRLRGALRSGPAGPLDSPRGVNAVLGLLRTLRKRMLHGRGSPKQFPDGGRVVAIVGPDASGKSTMVSATTRWLGTVFRVQTAHLGKPPSAWLTLLPNLAMRVMRVVTPQLRTTREDAMRDGEARARGRGLLYSLRAVILAWDRRALALRLAGQAARGWIIVCDRYPSPVVGAPDGARLPEPPEGATGLRAWLARLEQRLYRDVPAPDIVVCLSAPLNVAIDRNRDRVKAGKETAEFVTRRHASFFLPAFLGARSIELDTNQAQSATVQSLYRKVWRHLGKPRQRARGRAGFPACPSLRGNLVVEFIGVTGVGKSTLMAATKQALSDQGYLVQSAEECILARWGLSMARHPKLQSALVHLLSLLPLIPYLCTRDGFTLARLGLAAIPRGRNGLWAAFGLYRNFFKRIGCHLLLEKARARSGGAELVLCDEGVVHAAHNLFVHTRVEPNKQAIVLFGRLVPKPDLLIWVTAPTTQSSDVILRRGHSRVAHTAGAAHAFAENAHATFEALAAVEGIADRVLRFDNTVRPESNGSGIHSRAVALADLLKVHLGGWQAPGPSLREVLAVGPLCEPSVERIEDALPNRPARPAALTLSSVQTS